jgi:hypothetical protein
MAHNAAELRVETLPDIKPHIITKLKTAGIETIFDLAIAIPHELTGGILARCT